MFNLKLPAGHTELARVLNGSPFTNIPGERYCDVEVLISVREETFRVRLEERRGTFLSKGHSNPDKASTVVGRDISIDEASKQVVEFAKGAKIGAEYMVQALSQARDEAVDKMLDLAAAKA